MRGNPSIWRLAKWLFENIAIAHMDEGFYAWGTEEQWHKDILYDRAHELYSKLGIASTLGLEDETT